MRHAENPRMRSRSGDAVASLPPQRPQSSHCLHHTPRQGVSDNCLDFCPDPNAEAEELWQPEGIQFINGELKIAPEPFYYDYFPVSDRLTAHEKLELLDTHPLFTGRCPQCEMPYPRYEESPVHWDCDQCGWLDDTV